MSSAAVDTRSGGTAPTLLLEQMEEFARILTTKKWGMHQDLGLYFGRHSTEVSYLCDLLMVICGMMFVKDGNNLIFSAGRHTDNGMNALTGNARWRYTPCRVEALKEGEHYEIVH